MLLRPPAQYSQAKEYIISVSQTGDEADITVKEDSRPYSHMESRHPDEPVKVKCGEPIFVNPNSYETVTEVLRAIGKAANVSQDASEESSNARKWLKITMDGLPYSLARNIISETFICTVCNESVYGQDKLDSHFKKTHPFCPMPRLKTEFGWVVLSAGKLHVEMNMVRHFFSLNWEVFMGDLAHEMGFISEKAQQYAMSGGDHHIAWQLLDVAIQGNIRELMVPYVRQKMKANEMMSVNDFILFAATATNPNYTYLFEQTYRYAGAILVYRMGVRLNRADLIKASSAVFAPMWSKSRDSKYQLIDKFDRLDRAMMPPELARFMEQTESISTTGNPTNGEDMDARLEEINKSSKRWAVGAMFASEWRRTFRNLDNLGLLRKKTMELIQYSDDTRETSHQSRKKKNNEVTAWRVKLRKERYLTTPLDQNQHKSVSGNELDPELVSFTSTCSKNMEIILYQCVLGNESKASIRSKFVQIYVTPEQRKKGESLQSRTKAELIAKAEEVVKSMRNENTKAEFEVRMQEIKKKALKEAVIDFLNAAEGAAVLDIAEDIAKNEAFENEEM
ncbi:uncharacterized protein [Ptychodera flava]|uniref:uncharacterized protein n=1 Tax=Ptychodera flava TaxID=63121 RepID=UPI00396A7453